MKNLSWAEDLFSREVKTFFASVHTGNRRVAPDLARISSVPLGPPQSPACLSGTPILMLPEAITTKWRPGLSYTIHTPCAQVSSQYVKYFIHNHQYHNTS